MRAIKILTLVVLAVLLLLVAGRDHLLALGTAQLLRMRGATDVTVRVDRVSLHRVRFDTIAFSLPLAGDRLVFRLHNLSATYAPASLVAGRVRDVSIDSLALRLPKQATTSGSPASGLPLSLAGTAWQRRIPLRRLTIRRLRLAGGRTAMLAGKDLSLAMNVNHRGLHAVLALAGAPDTAPLRLRADLAKGGSLKLRLETGQEATTVSRLTLDAGRRGRLTSRFTVHLDRLARIAALFNITLPRLGGTINGSGSLATGSDTPAFSLALRSGELNISSLAVRTMVLRLEGTVRDHGREIALADASRLTLTNVQGPGFTAAGMDLPLASAWRRQGSALVLAPRPGRQWTLTGLAAAGWRCATLRLNPALTLTRRAGRTTLSLARAFRLQAGSISRGDLHLDGLALAPRQRTGIVLRPGKQWSADPGDWLLDRLVLSGPGRSLHLQPVTVAIGRMEGAGGHWSARADLQSQGVIIANGKRRLPLSSLAVHLEGDNSRLRGRAAFSAGELPGRLEAVFQLQAAAGRGRARLNTTTPLRFSPEHPLASLLAGLPADLDQGSLFLTATASWSATTRPALRIGIRLDNGAGKAGDLAFSGLRVRERAEILPRIRSLTPATVSLATLDAGIKMQDLEAVVRLTPSPAGPGPLVHLDRFAARLLGGRVSTSGLVLDPNRPDGHCTIAISGLDLAEIVRVMQVRDLQVSGRVDGRLPLRLDAKGISINNGELRNRPPGGVIRYRPRQKSSLAEMEITGYALKAMEDFRYNLLSAKVEYRPGGQLNVALHLEGHSPKLETTRPVHLNINTEQNLLSLLKSLQYSRSLTDELDKSIQRHYNVPQATGP